MARLGAGFGPVAWISTWSPVALTPVTDQPAPLAQCSATAWTSVCRMVVWSIRFELMVKGTIIASRRAAMMATAPR